jgi:uroporphyrinogen decarboxylase
MRKRERLEKAIAGEVVDRIPVALWRHWPGDDQRAADLARSIIDFQHDYNWDFVRVMPSQNFQVIDYGAQDEWQGDIKGMRQITKTIVKRSLDWTELRSLSTDRGILAQQIQCMRLVCSAFESEDVPVVHTIYSPFAQATRLSRSELVLRNMRTHPDRLRTGLNIITESTLRFIEGLRRIPNVAGVFFVTEFANYDTMSEAEYASFAMPYNLKILESLPDRWWFNVVQVQGMSPMLRLFSELPVQVINWNTRDGHPDLSQAKSLFPGATCGGLGDWSDLHQGMPSIIQDVIREAIHKTESRRFILTNSDSGYATMPISNIRAVRSLVESMAL